MRYLSVLEATLVLAREGRVVSHVLAASSVLSPVIPKEESAWSEFYRRIDAVTRCGTNGLHTDTFIADDVMRALLERQRRHIRWRLPGIGGSALKAAVAWSNCDSGPMSRVGAGMQRLQPGTIIVARHGVAK